MICNECGKKNQSKLPPKVVEIINEAQPVLFHRVDIAATLGDDTQLPPDTLDYKNVLAVYLANNHAYLYSSDGVPTFISMNALAVDEIEEQIKTLGAKIDGEVTILNNSIDELQSNLDTEIQTRENQITGLQETDAMLQEDVTRAQSDVAGLDKNLNTLNESIDSISDAVSDNTNSIAQNASAIADEKTAREHADMLLATKEQVTEVANNVNTNASNITDLQNSLADTQANVTTNTTAITAETSAREEANKTLQQNIDTNTSDISSLNTAVESNTTGITTLQANLNEEVESRTSADTILQNNIDTNTSSIEKVSSDLATETQNRTTAEANLQKGIDDNATAISGINTNLNQEVEQATAFNASDSTLDVVHTKVNLGSNSTTEVTDALPVASATQAGVMNAATYNAVQENADNIDSILVGAVALDNIAENPTQDDLTEAWKTATGKTDLVNRASIYDTAHKLLWYYYTNTNTWYSSGVDPSSIVTVNQATNDALGIVKGSTIDGQSHVEADGSLSVNGWDTVKADITSQGELLNTTVAQLEETQKDANDALGDIATIQADYVSKAGLKTVGGESIVGEGDISVPKLYDSYSTRADGANTANFINSILQGSNLALGQDASATGSNSVALGSGSSATRDYELNIKGGTTNRIIGGLANGELDTDAVTVSQLDSATQVITTDEFNAAWEAA